MYSTQNLLTWSCELEMLCCRCGHRCCCCRCCFCVCQNVTTQQIGCLPLKLPNRWKWCTHSNKRSAKQHITIIETNGSRLLFSRQFFNFFFVSHIICLFVCLLTKLFACFAKWKENFGFPFWCSVCICVCDCQINRLFHLKTRCVR